MMINGFRDTLFLEKPISPFVKYKNCPVIWLIHETSTPVASAPADQSVRCPADPWCSCFGGLVTWRWDFSCDALGICSATRVDWDFTKIFCNVQDFDIFHSLCWFNWLHICINDLWHSPWFNDSMPSPRPCVYTSKEHPKTNRCEMLNQANRWVLWDYGPHPLVGAPG